MSESASDDVRRLSLAKILKVTFAVAGTLAILFLAKRYLSVEALKDSLSELCLFPLIASMILYVVINFIRGYRFILLGADLGFVDALSISFVHTALLRVMPLRSGELSVGLMLKRTGKGGFGQGVFTILILRLIDFALIMILAALSLSAYLKMPSAVRFAMIVLITAALVGFLFFLSTPIAKALDSFIAKQGEKARTSLWIRAIGALAAILELSLKRRILLLLSSAFLWGVILVWFYLLLIGTGIVVSAADGFTVSTLGIVGSMLPLSLIGSFGPMEGGFAVGLAAVGFSPEIAASRSVIVSSLTFVQNWILAIPAGIWVFALASKKRR